MVAAPEKILAERPDDLARLLRAHIKAIAFLNERPEEANRIVAAALKFEPIAAPDGSAVTPEAIVAEARKRLGWSAAIEPSDKAFIQRLIDYSVRLGFLSQPMKADDILDDGPFTRASAPRP